MMMIMEKLSERWVSLRTKIILPYMLLALTLAAGVAYIGTQVVFDSIEERFVNQLIETGKLSSEWMAREENRLLETLRLLAHTEGIPEAIKIGDAERLRELAYPVAVNSFEEAVEFLDLQGIGILSTHHRMGEGIEDYDFTRGSEDFKQRAFVQKVLQGQSDSYGDKYAGLVRMGTKDYFYVSGPIFDDEGNLAGIILVGKSLHTLVREIWEETLARATVYDLDGQPIATTFLEAQALDIEAVSGILARQDDESFTRDLYVSNIDYSEILGPWEARRGDDIGLLGVSFAKNFLVRLTQNTWLQILLIVSIAFLLVIVIGFLVSSHISQPILRLEQAASRVADGDLSVQVKPTARDEVALLTQRFNAMVSSLHRSKMDLVAAYDTTLEGWAKVLELRDIETEGHSHRVTDLTLRLARAMGLDGDDLDHFRRGALLHDIGKMAIPDHILLKTGPLTDEEWKIMRQHPIYAVEMLHAIPFLRPALDIPRCHHEKWDGSGYPHGLKGEEIPLAARIFTVVDVWDALRSDRPYRPAIPVEEARKIIQQESGTHFDPRIVEVFLSEVLAVAMPSSHTT
jgi:putative nucleotidyltransferase with HDIG domain